MLDYNYICCYKKSMIKQCFDKSELHTRKFNCFWKISTQEQNTSYTQNWNRLTNECILYSSFPSHNTKVSFTSIIVRFVHYTNTHHIINYICVKVDLFEAKYTHSQSQFISMYHIHIFNVCSNSPLAVSIEWDMEIIVLQILNYYLFVVSTLWLPVDEINLLLKYYYLY